MHSATTSMVKQSALFHTLWLNILRHLMDLEANFSWYETKLRNYSIETESSDEGKREGE